MNTIQTRKKQKSNFFKSIENYGRSSLIKVYDEHKTHLNIKSRQQFICFYHFVPGIENSIALQGLTEGSACPDFLSGFNIGLMSCPSGNTKPGCCTFMAHKFVSMSINYFLEMAIVK